MRRHNLHAAWRSIVLNVREDCLSHILAKGTSCWPQMCRYWRPRSIAGTPFIKNACILMAAKAYIRRRRWSHVLGPHLNCAGWIVTGGTGWGQELHMTGCAVITDTMALVIVEGGEKAQKRYNKLMLRRINWQQGRDDPDGEASL